MNFRHKAVEIIKEQMVKEGESPLLYCMLGDATDDPKNYEKAIELSKGQLISKCPFGITKSTKNQQKICKDFCPSL